MGQLVGAYSLRIVEGLGSKSCEAHLKVIHIAHPLTLIETRVGLICYPHGSRVCFGQDCSIVGCWSTMGSWVGGGNP